MKDLAPEIVTLLDYFDVDGKLPLGIRSKSPDRWKAAEKKAFLKLVTNSRNASGFARHLSKTRRQPMSAESLKQVDALELVMYPAEDTDTEGKAMMESTSEMLARLEAVPGEIERLMLEEWNPDVLEESLAGVSVEDAVEDLIDDYGDVGEITLAAIGRELMDIGKNSAGNVRKAVQALKKSGIKVVRR